MMKINLLRCKHLLLIIVIGAIIVRITSCHFAKREFENHALIEAVKQCYVEAFENYKHGVRPMFASNRIMALKLWRREIRRLHKRCGYAVNEHSYASDDLESSVQDLISAIDQFRADLSNWDLEDREQQLATLKQMDRKYESFCKTAGGFDRFVEKVVYYDEYR